LPSHAHNNYLSDDIKKPSIVFITETRSGKKMTDNVQIIKLTEKLTINEIFIDGVPAYNKNKDYHSIINVH